MLNRNSKFSQFTDETGLGVIGGGKKSHSVLRFNVKLFYLPAQGIQIISCVHKYIILYIDRVVLPCVSSHATS